MMITSNQTPNPIVQESKVILPSHQIIPQKSKSPFVFKQSTIISNNRN